MRTLYRISALLIVVAFASCSEADSPRLPLAPTPVAQPGPSPAPPPSTTRLAGQVTDTAFRPLADARVEVLDGPHAGSSIGSNALGEFTFRLEHVDDTTRVRAEKEGYVTAIRTPLKCQTCPHYNVRFQLALPIEPVRLAGNHTLTFVTDPACVVMPTELRTRSYPVTLTPSPFASVPNTVFTASVADTEFLPNYSEFLVYAAGDYVAFNLEESEGPWLIEKVAENAYLGIGGVASATVTVTSGAAAIVAPFTGTIDYCVLAAPMGKYFSCESPLARARCASANHQLILTRR